MSEVMESPLRDFMPASPLTPGPRDPATKDPHMLTDQDRVTLGVRERGEMLDGFVAGRRLDRVTERAYGMFRRRLQRPDGTALIGQMLAADETRGHERIDGPLWHLVGLARAEFDPPSPKASPFALRASGDRSEGGRCGTWTEIEADPVAADGAGAAARPGVGVMTLPVLEWTTVLATEPDWATQAAAALTADDDEEGWREARALGLVRDVLVAIDIIAIELQPSPGTPRRWARLTGAAAVLGERAIDFLRFADIERSRRVRLYRDPLAWWRDGNASVMLPHAMPRWNTGACILESRSEAAETLLSEWELVCDDAGHAAETLAAQQRVRKRRMAAIPKPRKLRVAVAAS